MKHFLFALLAVFIIFGCIENESNLYFKESTIIEENGATIEISYPSAMGNEDVAAKINDAIKSTIAEELSFTDEIDDRILSEAISNFNKEYRIFKNDFPESNQVWEVNIEGEVIYQSPELISISLSTYIDTGGAHGNTHIVFLNFNPEIGKELTRDELMSDKNGFLDLAKEYFKMNLEESKSDLNLDDSFYGENFQLPETIGFSEVGIIMLYNTYEIAAYSFGITEFEIPWEEVSQFISRR